MRRRLVYPPLRGAGPEPRPTMSRPPKPLRPAGGIRLVAFDVDGTLADGLEFVWALLHDHFRTDPVARRWAHDSFFAGKITYEEWARHDVMLLQARGATFDGVREALRPLRPMEGTDEVLRVLRRFGLRLAILSGSVDVALAHVLPDYPEWFDHVLINQFVFDEEGRLADVIPTPYDITHKAEGLRRLAREEGLDLEQCAFIGDHYNDVDVARVAGLSMAFNCQSPELAAVADVVVAGKDLRAVLPRILRG